jgi:hypothetical protein
MPLSSMVLFLLVVVVAVLGMEPRALCMAGILPLGYILALGSHFNACNWDGA